MYNVFWRSVMSMISTKDGFIDVRELRVFKADNKNTLRRLRGEGWHKVHELPVCDRKVAVVVKNKMQKEQQRLLSPFLECLTNVIEKNQKW